MELQLQQMKLFLVLLFFVALASAVAGQTPVQKSTFVNEGGLRYKYQIDLVVNNEIYFGGTFTRKPLDADETTLDTSAETSATNFSGVFRSGQMMDISMTEDSTPYNKPEGPIRWKMITRKKVRYIVVPYMARLEDGKGGYVESTMEFKEVKP